MMNLIYLKAKIINFYKEEKMCYAKFHKNWIENDNTGLKGAAAFWSERHLEKNSLDSSIIRVKNTKKNREKYLK